MTTATPLVFALPKGRKDDPAPNFSYERMKAEVLAVDPNAGM